MYWADRANGDEKFETRCRITEICGNSTPVYQAYKSDEFSWFDLTLSICHKLTAVIGHRCKPPQRTGQCM